MDCVIIRIVDLPLQIKGATVKDEEGDYNIYINARLSTDERAAAYRHEILHIQLGHFYDERPVAEKEAEVHAKTEEDKGRDLDDTRVHAHGRIREEAL